MLFTFLDSALLPQLLNGLYVEGGDEMKGLFLPGFKMPKCCETCIANDDDWMCNVLERNFDYDAMAEKRFDDCPLIEVEVDKTEVTE